ncbi:MAG: hypothetical protein AAGK74_01065, partial [Chloroflexota bacterium]
TATEAVEAPSIEINIDFRRLLTRDIFLMLALLAVAWVARSYAIEAATFPIRDGALQYQAALTVQNNDFRFPVVIPYNGDDFPFFYPPLGIFIAAVVSQQFQIPLLDTFRLMRTIFSALTVPVIYMLCRTIFVSKPLSFVAALVFALMPASVLLTVQGSGVVTTPGLFFALLGIHQAFYLIPRRNENHLLPAAILITLAFLFDLAMGAFALNTALLMLALRGRNRFSALNWLLLVISVIVLVGLWFFPIMLIHGDRLYGAVRSIVAAGRPIETVVQTANSNIGGEVVVPLITLLGLIGFFVAIARRRFFLPLWYVMIVLLQAGNAPLLLTIPLSMLAAGALVQLVFPLIAEASFNAYEEGFPALRFATQEIVRNLNKQVYHLPAYVAGLILLAYAVYSLVVSADPLRNPQIPDVEQDAMAWIDNNLPDDARFLVITDGDDWQTDTIQDWFPVLANRNSVINVRESLWNGTYAAQIDYFDALVACKGRNLDCLFELEEQIALDAGAVQEETADLTQSDLVRLRSGGIQQETAPRLRVFDFVYVSAQERGALSGFIALDSINEINYRPVRNAGGVLILQPVEDEPLDTSQFTQ